MKKINNQQELEECLQEAQKLSTQIEAEVSGANTAFSDVLDEITSVVAAKKAELDELEAAIENFAKAPKNREEYFGDKKSMDLLAGTIAFKLGKQSVETTAGFNAETFADIARKYELEELIRTPPAELDKAAVLRLYAADELTEGQLKKLGIKVIEPTDEFSIKYKKIDKKKVGA